MVYGGGGRGGGGAGGRLGGGPGLARRIRSSLDANDQESALGKAYDARVIRRIPPYLAWVKKTLILAAAGTAMRTAANVAMPYLVAVITDRFIKTGNLSGLNLAVLVYVAFALLMWGGQYLETLYLSYSGQSILRRMRTQMFDHLLQLSMGFFDRKQNGQKPCPGSRMTSTSCKLCSPRISFSWLPTLSPSLP